MSMNLIKIGEVHIADLTGIENSVLLGVRAVIILDIKSKDEIVIMPIAHPVKKSLYVESSSAEVEIEVDIPIKNTNEVNNVINNQWVTTITKDRLIDKIGTIKSMKMKMYFN